MLQVAKIHAENAIRQKNQSLNFLRMSARIDATASRVQSAVTTKKVSKSMEVLLRLVILSLQLSFSGGCEGHECSNEVHEP